MASKSFVVFSDLDGTLLDHHDYSFDAALPALHALKQQHIPVVLNSSKTQPEMERLREQMANSSPYIVENGAAVIIPHGTFGNDSQQVVNFAEPLQRVHSVLLELRKQGFRFCGFNDMTAKEVAVITGLNPSAAEFAKQRIATEPMLWQDSEEQLVAFTQQLQQQDLQLIKGGRFYHVMGHYDKADAMVYLMDRYQQTDPEKQWCSIALGDSPNDERMLEKADYSVVIKGVNSDSVLQNCTKKNVIRSEQKGPVGWNESILRLLELEA